MAWFYPYGHTGVQPDRCRRRDVRARAGTARSSRSTRPPARRSGSTKPERHHQPGINYWQSEDGKDKRLIFCDQQLPPGDRRDDRQDDPTFGDRRIVDLREGLLRGESTAVAFSRTARQGLEEPADPGIAPGEAFDDAAWRHPRVRRDHRQAAWQFHTVPRPGEFGYETWPKDACKYVGGANNWGELSVDDERGIVYMPTGSATYDFYGADRHGQDLFANCLLALDARTGKRLWHFQTMHHDLWDFDNVSAPQLVTVRHNGRSRRRRAGRARPGFLYVFNRVTGAAALADRRAAGAEERRARRAVLADAAVPDQAAAVRRARRSPSTTSIRSC